MNRLKELRKQAGLTQANVAEEIGVSRQAIDFYEHDRNYPNIPILIKIAKFFHVSTDYLLGVSDE